MYWPSLTHRLHRLVNTCPVEGSLYSVIDRTSSLPAGLGVIATVLRINPAPSIDIATIRIVRLIIVLPGLSFPRCETSRRRKCFGESVPGRKRPVQRTASASSLRGTGKLKRPRYDMMRRLLRTREFLRCRGSRISGNSQAGGGSRRSKTDG